ncbi:hypothetical protein [Salipiger mangrovisoli]|uniref:Transcriptional regulator n=1 Tax=Salipiger mangrovisoli TaxID=2865933 RepID=A0ABR9X7D9_9RHOB|nr:hypothetical protein [Salipiger mangrovisoli]MBE9639447.1 hypothetical protein [Salipiger mangrovisoli]
MEPKNSPRISPAQERETRLKAALKANLARRKAQAKARDAASTEDNKPEDGQSSEKDS